VAAVTQFIPAWIETLQKPAENDTFPLQLAAINDRIVRLTDALIDRLIDQEVFNERKAALLLDEARIKEKVEEIARAQQNAHCIPRFLELIKNLASTHQSAMSAEKQQIVEMATSNRIVIGKNVYVEPAKWLVEVGHIVSALCGAPAPDTDRTLIEQLVVQASGAQWTKLNKFDQFENLIIGSEKFSEALH
jgi:site-specific DNA recombinase